MYSPGGVALVVVTTLISVKVKELSVLHVDGPEVACPWGGLEVHAVRSTIHAGRRAAYREHALLSLAPSIVECLPLSNKEHDSTGWYTGLEIY